MPQISFLTPAKINLGLMIQKKLPNGYHQVETILHRVPLYDQLDLSWPHTKTELICEHKHVPNNSKNLIIKAYFLLKQDHDLPAMKIKLKKNIPIGAGLGGGSFNAGVFLQKIKAQFNLPISKTQMQAYALALGADVPFAVGIKECCWEKNHGLSTLQSQTLPSLPSCQLVLAPTSFALSTKKAYQKFQSQNRVFSNLNTLVQALKQQDLKKIALNLYNDFASLPELQGEKQFFYQKSLYQAGAWGVSLTGKGPTLFALFPPEIKINLPFPAQIFKIKIKKEK